MANMPALRYLCSHLVTMSWKDGASVVILEEIQADKCILESETEFPEREPVEIRCGGVFFAGITTKAEAHEFGWRITVDFSPLTPWSIDRFRPEHLTDPALLAEPT